MGNVGVQIVSCDGSKGTCDGLVGSCVDLEVSCGGSVSELW
jgi:hypothetical protein